MPALAPTESSSCASPVLDINLSSGGSPVNVSSLEFQIFELVTDPENPIQISPLPAPNRTTVNVGQSCPTGDRLSTGRYVAQYTVPAGALIGTHLVKWFYKLAATSTEQCFQEEFEIIPVLAAASPGNYCSLAEVRAEGVNDPPYPDARIESMIELASRYIDRYTGRFFTAVAKTVQIDGRGTPELILHEPIVEITSVTQKFHNDAPSVISLDDLEIYNRHLTQNLTQPDDRNNPKISYLRSTFDNIRFNPKTLVLNFLRGRKNITIDGTFGYRDYDGSAIGKVPPLIARACMLLALRNLDPAIDSVGGVGVGSIRRERTRHQEVEYGDPSLSPIRGAFTGDPEIDQLIVAYKRPPYIGSA